MVSASIQPNFDSLVVKNLGALPVVVKVIRDLGVRDVVDHYCPIRDVADYSHGLVAEILLANRLTAPHPLYAVEQWAAQSAAAEFFGVDASKLNDDRLARTLDAISSRIDEIQLAISERAVRVFGLDLEQVHLDITSFMLEGAYENNDPDFPEPKRGYNSERDFRRKQLRTGQAVIRDGNVPIFFATFDGNRTDTDTLKHLYEGLAFLRALARPKKMIHVGDSKLLAAGNLLFLLREEVLFVAPGERRKEFRESLSALDPAAWKEVSYASETELKRRRKAPRDQWNRFWVQETSETLIEPKTKKKYKYRRLIIRSSEEVRAARKSRDRQLGKAEEELTKLQNGIPRYYKTPAEVSAKAEAIVTKRRVNTFLEMQISTENGLPRITWSRNETAIERAEATSGCYPLLTNLPPERSAAEVLSIQKDQYRVEHRFSDWKGPLEVCPIFLKNNNRIAALLTVTGVALTVLSLIERRVRLELGDEDGYAIGFYPEKRKSRPTGKKILLALKNVMALVQLDEPSIVHVANVTPFVQKLFAIFGVCPKKLI